MNLAELVDRHGKASPTRTAVLDAQGRVSWAELRSRVAHLAAWLKRRGLRRGDRVALLARNSRSFLETVLATSWAGLVMVPLNWRLSSAEIAFQLRDTEASLIAAEPEFASLLADADAGIPRLLLPDDLDRAARDAPVPRLPSALAADALFGIFYTGGTTGVPKGVMLTHRNLLANVENLQTLVPYTQDDVHLHAAPMFHLADLGYAVAALAAGSAHGFLPSFSPPAFFDHVARIEATATLLAPAMIGSLVRAPDLTQANLRSWRRLMYGGAPVSAAVLDVALRDLPCALIQGYGQTEATHTITTLTDADHRLIATRPELALSCGRPAPGVQVLLCDDHDRPVSPGEPGEVCVRAATVMTGYWRRPAETEAALRGGWLHTGDVGRLDQAGYLTLLDRRKDMIVSGAENIYSVEVENALAAHQAVAEAAVIAVPDPEWGERVHAVVTLGPGHTVSADELRAHCRTLIGGYKIPKSIEFVDALPRTATGKLRKDLLRRPYWPDNGRKIS